MDFLFIIGGSGSGKTTLAKMLQETLPDRFNLVRGTTTRVRRENETDADYEFITDEDYDEALANNEFIGQSVYVMKPNKYGYRKSLLSETKTNILIVSIEGFLNAVHSRHMHDNMLLYYINSDKPFVDRLDRDFNMEDRFNKGVLSSFIRKDGDKEKLYINTRVIRFNMIDKEQIKEYHDKIIDSERNKLHQ